MKKNSFMFSLFLIVSLFLLITLTQRKTEIPSSVQRADAPKFIPFELNSLTKLGIILPSGEIKINKSENANWKITYPIIDDANNIYIDSLIDKIAKMRVRATYSESDLGQPEFELNPPPVKLILENKSLKTVVFELGTENRIDNSLLFRTSDSPLIFKVVSPNLKLSTKTLNSFRSPFLLKPNQKDFDKFSVYKNGNLQFSVKKVNDEWLSDTENPKPIKESEAFNINETISSLTGAQILEYVLDDKSIENALQEYGLENPIYEIRFSQTEKTDPTIIIFSDILGPQMGASDNRVAATSNEKSGVYFIHADAVRNIDSFVSKFKKHVKL
jgi:hypothetical protein